MEILELQEKLNNEIYISVDKYCELKNISKSTFWRKRNAKKINHKIVKLKGYGKKYFLQIKKEKIIYIDKNDNINIIL